MGGGRHLVQEYQPSDLSDVVGEYAQADARQTEQAIAAARAAFAWATFNVQARADMLDKIGNEIIARKDELGTLLSREEGKTLPEGVGEVVRAGNVFKFFAGEVLRRVGELVPSVRAGVDVEITREPVGVVGIISPWNFPSAIPAWKVAPALAYGNCVVFKPADLVPGSSWALAEIIARAGVPAGAFNLVMGRGSVWGGSVNDTRVDAISFAGSETGARSRRKCAHGQVSARDGRQNPLVVLDDADLKTAVSRSRQRRLLLHRPVHRILALIVTREPQQVRRGVDRAAQGPVVDNALKPGTQIGRWSTESAQPGLVHIEEGKRGARLAYGGNLLKREGGFIRAGAVHRHQQRHASIARRSSARWPRCWRRRTRRSAGGQRHSVRSTVLHRHRSFKHAAHFAAQPGRNGHGEPAHRGSGLSRAVRYAASSMACAKKHAAALQHGGLRGGSLARATGTRGGRRHNGRDRRVVPAGRRRVLVNGFRRRRVRPASCARRVKGIERRFGLRAALGRAREPRRLPVRLSARHHAGLHRLGWIGEPAGRCATGAGGDERHFAAARPWHELSGRLLPDRPPAHRRRDGAEVDGVAAGRNRAADTPPLFSTGACGCDLGAQPQRQLDPAHAGYRPTAGFEYTTDEPKLICAPRAAPAACRRTAAHRRALDFSTLTSGAWRLPARW